MAETATHLIENSKKKIDFGLRCRGGIYRYISSHTTGIGPPLFVDTAACLLTRPSPASPTATDNCDPDPAITFSEWTAWRVDIVVKVVKLRLAKEI